jgi:predicted MFS family arabinose efflux permease
VLALLLGRVLVPTSKDPSAPRVDVLGAGLSVAGLSALLYGIIEGPRHGWADPLTLGALGAGLTILAGFVAWELHSEEPMLNVRFFRNPRFTAASLSVTLVFFAIAGVMFFLTQHLQFMLGYTPLQAGLRIMPIALSAAAGAPVGATMANRYGSRITVFLGLLITASAFVVMATISESSGFGLVAVAMVLGGFGSGVAMTPATDSIMGSLPKEKAGVGSAVNDTTREVGGALGVAVLGSLLSSVFASGMADAVRGLPAQAAEIARDGIGGALAVAQQVGGAPGRAIAGVARTAFIDGAGTTMLVAAAVAVLGALVALVWLPARERAETQEVIRVEVEPVDVKGLVTERVA